MFRIMIMIMCLDPRCVNYDYDYVFVIKTNFTLTPAKMFRGTCGYHLSKEDKNCSHLHLHVCTDCTAAAVRSMLLRS